MSQFPTVIVGVTAQGGFVPFNGGEVSEDRTALLSIFGVTEAAQLIRDRVIVNYQFDSDAYAMKPGLRAISMGAGGDIGWRWLSWITGFSGGFTGAKGEGNTWEYRPNAAIAGVGAHSPEWSNYGWDTFVTQSSIANWYKWGVRKFHLHLPWGKVPLGTYGQTAGSDQNYLNTLKAQGNTWTPEALYYQPDAYVCAREGFIDPFSGLTGNLPMPWLTNDTVDGVVQGFVPLFQTLISGSTSESKLSADIWERLTGCCGASAWYNPADPIEVSCYLGTVNSETFPRWKRWWEAWTATAPGTVSAKVINPLSGTAESQNYFLSQTLSGVSYANARLLASYEPVARAGMKLALDALVDCPGPVVQQNKVGKNPLPLFSTFNENLSINFGLPGTPNSITKSPLEFKSGITYGVTLDRGWWNFFSTQIVPTFGRNRVYAESHPWTVPVNGEWSGALGWTANPYLGFNIMTAEEWGRAGFGGDPNSTALNKWRSHYRGEYGNVEYLGVVGDSGSYPHVGQYTTSGGTVLNGEYGHLATKTDGTPNSRLLRRLAEAGEGSNLQPPLPTNDPDARFIRLNTLPIPDPINGTDFANGYPGEVLWGGDWVLNGLLRKPYQTNDPTLANDKTVHFVNMPTNTIFRLPNAYSSQLLTAYGITAEFIRRFPNIQSFAQHLAVLKTNGHSVLAGGKTFAPPSYTRGSGSETPEALASAQVNLAKRRERVERIEGTLWLDPEEYDVFAGTNLSGQKNGKFYVPTVEADLPQQRLNLWLDAQIRHWLDRFGTYPRNIAWKMTKAGRWGESLSINSSQATLQGDVNGDGVVDSLDISLVLAAFGSVGGPADVNGDGIVDTIDLGIVLANQGSVASGEGTKTFTPNGFEMERYLFQPRTIPNPDELASNPNNGLGFGGTNRWLYWGGQTAGTRWDTSISSEKLLNTGYDMERIGSPADPLFTAAQSIVTAMVNRTKAWKTTRKIPSRIGVKNIPFLPKTAYPVYRIEPVNGRENSNAVLKASGNWNDSVFPVGVTADSVFLSKRTTTDWHTASDTVKIKAAIKTEFRKRIDPIAAECEVLMPEILDFGTDHLPSDNIDQTIDWQKEQLNVAHDLKTVGSWSTSNNGTLGAPVFSGAIVPCTSSLNWGADYPGMSYGDPRTTKRGVLFDENGSYYRTIDWLVDEFVRQRGRNPTAVSRKIAGLCIDRSYLERLWNALRSDSSSSRTADRNWVSRWKRAEEGSTGYINWASTNAVYGSTGTQAFFTYSTDQDTKRLNRFRFLVPPGGRINPYKGGVFAVTWTQGYDPIGHPQAIDGLTITDVVPYVRLGDRLRLDEGAGYTGPLPNPYMNTTVTRARYIPQDKRVLLPYYYHQDPISDFRSGTDYWKNTGDGATYTGSLAYRAHESAGNLRIPTPWAYRQAAAAAESIMASLGVLGATGITFGYISDGTESLRLFSPASFIHSWEVFGPTGMPAVLNDQPDGSPFYYVERLPSYLTEPDTRIVSSFLNGVTVDTAVSEVSGLSFAASVEKYYKEMVANVENMGHYAHQAIGIPPNQTASATYDDIVGYYANEGLNSTIQTNGIPHGISASTGPAWSSVYAPPYVPAALQPAFPPAGNPYRSPYYYTMSVSNGRTISNYIAWKASERALWNHVYGDLLKIQWVDPLEQSTNKQYRGARFAKSEYFPTSIPEGALTRTGFGHSFMEYNEIPWLDPSPYLYGRSASYMWDSWYYPNPTTPFQRHQIENRSGMAGAVRFNGARSYIAFLLEVSLTRAMLRTNPRLWRHFSPWTTGNYEGSAGSIWSFDVADQSASGAQKTDPQYNKELTFHLLTTGVPYLNYFHARVPAQSGYTAGVTWMQGILNEWNSLTNGQRVQPVSTVDGSPDTLQERILMKDVGGNHEGATGVFMSGCRVLGYSRGKTGERGYPNETYLWRLTAAPQATTLYRVDDPSRILSDLPATITLDSERGAWIRRVGISEPPMYTMASKADFSIDPVPNWTDILATQGMIGAWSNLQTINGTNRTVTLRLIFSKNTYPGWGTSTLIVNRNGTDIATIPCVNQPAPYEFTAAPSDSIRFRFTSTRGANFTVSVFNVSQSQLLDTFGCVSLSTGFYDEPSFEDKFNLVFDYLIGRYEPGWSAADETVGAIATRELLQVSAASNPLIAGGEVEEPYNYTTNGNQGWFDPITHPKKFASAVRTAYRRLDRARSPVDASLKFVDYNLQGINCQDYLPNGGNAYFGYHPDFTWYGSEESLPFYLHMGYAENHRNHIRRTLIHSPYGNFTSPMNSYEGNWRRFPWLSDRYTGEAFIFDMYPLIQEKTTLRDLLTNDIVRNPMEGILVNGIVDQYLNTTYSGMSFPAGLVSKQPYNDYDRNSGGYADDEVLIGEPWISFPNGITYDGWFGSGTAGLCFNYETLTLFDGSTFPGNPPDYSSAERPPMSSVIGLSFDYGSKLIQSLNDLSDRWGSKMEFIAYLGNLPYGTGFEMRIPLALYRDPTIPGNREYMKWRMDASVQHWKNKFKSPFNGFANVFADAAMLIERTYHRWQPDDDYTEWTNIASNGEPYVENIPVEWSREQYNYTYGVSGPDPEMGVVLGVERFAQYNFKDDVGIQYPERNDQRRFDGDQNPRHWCLDNDQACALFSACHDITLGQRKWGLDYSNSIWGFGINRTSNLGEVFVDCIPQTLADSDLSAMSGMPFFHGVFTESNGNGPFGEIKWKRVPGTSFNNTSSGVPWVYDRRFRLFYLYPTMLAMNCTILDIFHNGAGYYTPQIFYGDNMPGWYDKSLGTVYKPNMEVDSSLPVVSNIPFVGRKSPTKPPQNYWNGSAANSEFELLYACMKGGITEGLDSLGFTLLFDDLLSQIPK